MLIACYYSMLLLIALLHLIQNVLDTEIPQSAIITSLQPLYENDH